MNKKCRNKAEQAELCKKYLSSDLGRKVFCEKYDINPKTLSRWMTHYKAAQKSELNFIPVGTVPKVHAEALAIELPNGIKLGLNLDATAVSSLVQELLTCK